MTSISSRRVRDVPGAEADDTWLGADGAARGFDYAKLLRSRSAPHRPVARVAQTPQRTVAQSLQQDPDEPAQEALRNANDNAISIANHAAEDEPALVAPREASTDPALGSRVAHAAEPLVSSVFMRQQRMLDLVGTLAREIAGFCSDSAIVNGGNWDVQMPLDEHLAPHTTLYLTLSRFIIQLRFDAPDPNVKQLLLDHSSMLERELDATLRAWGESRDIQLTVW